MKKVRTGFLREVAAISGSILRDGIAAGAELKTEMQKQRMKSSLDWSGENATRRRPRSKLLLR